MTQPNIIRAWRAGFVRRWHTNPDLCHTNDTDAGHQQRVALLTILIFPDASRDLIVEALTHDQGEIGPGDISATARQRHPELSDMMDSCEHDERYAQGLPPAVLNVTDRRRLKLCDRLDSYLWARHHAPHVLSGDGWPEALEWVRSEIDALCHGPARDAAVRVLS